MGIVVNGKEVDYVEGETVTQLLKRMNFIFPMVVIKIDGSVIPRTEHSNTPVPDNSTIEAIHLISGG